MAHHGVNLPPNLANATRTQVDINDNYCRVKITLGEESQKTQAQIKAIIMKQNLKISSGQLFNSFKQRGKHKEIIFNYDADSFSLMIEISKSYFVNVLRLEEYQLLIIGRHLVTLLQEFLLHIKQFVKLMADQKTREWEVQIYSLDVISITIAKSFVSYDTSDNLITKKIFLRQSYFQFKRILSYRTRQSEQLYCYVIRTVPQQYGPQNQYNPIIGDKEFYIAPRINYVDDLHSNQSLLKRFSFRFLSYYQAFSLSYGLVPLDNLHIREFYRKCFNSHTFYGMRLKKFGFSFNIRRLMVVTSKDAERQRQMKASIYFYHDQQFTNASHQQHNSDSFNKNYFFLELNVPGVNQKFLQQNFMKRLRKNVSENDKFEIFARHPNSSKILVKPRNQNSYCMIINQFSFFTDFLFFKLIDIKDRKRKDLHRQSIDIPFSSEEDAIVLKFPPSSEFNLRKSKYYHSYQVGIYSRSSVKHNSTAIPSYKYERDHYNYENQIAQLKMIRRKKTNDIDTLEPAYDFLEKDNQNLKGLKIYLNSILHCWNARECFEDVTEFASAYLNIVSDKMKESKDRVYFKNYGKWPKVLTSLSYLLHALTEGFNTYQNTFFLKILQGYEDRRDGSEPGFTNDLTDEDCVMKMTISLYELTQAGWVQTLPGCVYFFDVYKSQIRVSMYCDKKIKVIPDGQNRRSIERSCKQYMRETMKQHKIKVDIPKNIPS